MCLKEMIKRGVYKNGGKTSNENICLTSKTG